MSQTAEKNFYRNKLKLSDYFTLDEFVQEEKSFQLNIQAKYKHLTK